MSLSDTIAKLRSLNESVPRPARLPSQAEITQAEAELGVVFHADLRSYLREASDVVFGTREPVTLTIPNSHTDMRLATREAWDAGVPGDWIPVCEDNGDFYCVRPDGSIAFWRATVRQTRLGLRWLRGLSKSGLGNEWDIRSSERAPACTRSGDADAAGGWLPSLTFHVRARVAMTSIAKRFTIGFTITLLVAVVLNLLPYLRTRGAIHGDGFEVVGFPFIFRSEGGFAWTYEFSYWALIADITLALVVALGVGYVCSRVRGRDSA